MEDQVTGIQEVYAPKIGQHLWLLRENGNEAFKIIIGLRYITIRGYNKQ
jgi:hypothetical protein